MARRSSVILSHVQRFAFGYRAFVATAAILACGGSGSDSTAPGGSVAAEIAITPTAPAVTLGSQVALQAQVRDASGQLMPGAAVFWSSSDTTIATVSAAGVVTGKKIGTTPVAASSGGQSAVVPVSVLPVPVASVAVLPSAATLVIGGTVTLQTIAYDADGNTLTGRAVTWTSSAAQVASVDESGKVTGATAGTAIISGTCEGKTASATITVTVVPVASVAVNPGSAALSVGQSASFTAVAMDAHGNVLGGRPVTWSSSNASVATVNSLGLVTGATAGIATITATVEGKTGTAQVAVTSTTPPPPTPVGSVAVTPGTASLDIGATVTLSATVRDSTGATLPGRTVTWASGNQQVATVTSTGVVTAVAPGSAVISASSGGKTGTATITVQPRAPNPVTSVTVNPTSATMIVGDTLTITATERDTSGNVLTGRTVTWKSNNPQIATVSSAGLVTAVTPGTAAITATSEGRNASAVVTVKPVPVDTVSVSPASASVVAGQTKQLSATAKDAHGNTLNGRQISWTSNATGVATVDNNGLVTAVAPGNATITATSEGKSGTAAITVTPVPVASVTVSPNSASIQVNNTVTLVDTTRDGSGNVLTGRSVTWSSSDTTKATVSQAGVVTAVSPGTATITATSEGKSGTAAVTITQAPVASVTVSPSSANIQVGNTATLVDTTRDASGHVLTGRTVVWTSSDTTVATVSQTGVVTGVAPGSVTITATSEGQSGTATVTVTQVPVASVQVTPASDSLQVGNSVVLTAQAFDANNNPLNNRTITWTTSDPNSTSISPATGPTTTVQATLLPLTPGPVTITATCEGTTGTSTITIYP